MAYPGFQRGVCLRSGPIQKVGGGLQVQYTKSGGGGGGGASGPIYQKWEGGGGASGTIYEKWGGGGGGALQVRYTKSGAIPLQIPLGTQKISTCTYLRATSHARANERNIHAGKG